MGSSRRLSSKRIFDVVDTIDSQDDRAKRQRRLRTVDLQRSKAAQSQTNVYTKLLESRILIQRSIQAQASDENGRDEAIGLCDQILSRLLNAQHQLSMGTSAHLEPPEDSRNGSDSKELRASIQGRFDKCKKEWQSVLDRRHSDVQLHSGKSTQKSFRALDTSFWQQVESTVQYEEANGDDKAFDDAKVYQHMLKEYCSASSLSTSESVSAVPQRKASNSARKLVDRRASKGRKIRYATIDKLVNFTFPVQRPDAGNLSQEAWFKSLFGGVAYQKHTGKN